MNGIRLLFVSHTATPGGSNEILLSLLRHAPPGAQCECVFLEPGETAARAAALGAGAHLIRSGRARQLWRAPGVVGGLRGAIRATRAEVVFAHVTKAHLYASLAARQQAVPYLWWQHERRSQKPVMHRVSAHLPAAAVICSSEWTAAEQRTLHSRTPVTCIHPGIEIGAAPSPRAHTAGSGDELTIAVIGRLQRWKRVELVLRAMAPLVAAEPRLRLRVIGGTTPGVDESYADELRREAHRLGIGSSVDFRGHVGDTAAELATCDVLVHAADCEPFGMVLLEAMLAGVPIVAADEGGPREIVRNGVDGLLVPADPEALAAAVLALTGDPARRARMGDAGQAAVLAQFSAERMARDAWALVRSVAAGN